MRREPPRAGAYQRRARAACSHLPHSIVRCSGIVREPGGRHARLGPRLHGEATPAAGARAGRGAEDGLEGEEGTFLLYTFWLAQAFALAGRLERAREVFERACGYASDLGLLAEEVDPGTGELLGNFPPAFSHIGLVNAAWATAEAKRPSRESASG